MLCPFFSYKDNSLMPDEHYLAPIIRAFLTTQAGIQLLDEPTNQPNDSRCKDSRIFLKPSETNHEAAHLESNYQNVNQVRPGERESSYSAQRSHKEHSPASQAMGLPWSNPSVSKHRKIGANNLTVGTNRSGLSKTSGNKVSSVSTPLLPQSHKRLLTVQPSQLNKSLVLKNDARSASLAAAENSTVPARSTGSSGYF